MNEQILILVDDNDNMIGSAPRSVCHAGPGKRHRAFVVLLINNDGEVLLQHRKSVKLGGERWDGSAISHVLVGENYESAARRSIKHELAINFGKPFIDFGAFVYEEHYVDNSENEYCKVLVGEWSGTFVANSEEMTEARFVPLKEVIDDVKKDIDHKKYTKWFHLTIQKFLESPDSKRFLS